MDTKETISFLCEKAKELDNITGSLFNNILAGYEKTGQKIPCVKETSAILRDDKKVVKYCSGDNRKFSEFVFLSQALTFWRNEKIVYSFDEETEEMLIKQEEMDDKPLPTSVLQALPYDSFFIKTTHTPYRHEMESFNPVPKDAPDYVLEYIEQIRKIKPIGFFVNKERSGRDGNLVLGLTSLLYDPENDILETRSSAIPLTFETLREAIDDELASINGKVKENHGIALEEKGDFMDMAYQALSKPYNEALQLLLYLCVENKEEEQDLENAKIYKKATAPQFSKFKPREVKEIHLGKETGVLIRKYKKEREYTAASHSEITHTTGKKKAPHPRAGHYHLYWTGKGRQTPVLKWVAPTFINKELLTQGNNAGVVIEVKRNKG